MYILLTNLHLYCFITLAIIIFLKKEWAHTGLYSSCFPMRTQVFALP